MKRFIVIVVLFAAMLLVLLDFGFQKGYAANTVFTDNFTTSVGSKWTKIGINNTPAHTSDGLMRLTSSGQSQVGTIWLNQGAFTTPILPPYTVSSRHRLWGRI
jgi:hypothetical protein